MREHGGSATIDEPISSAVKALERHGFAVHTDASGLRPPIVGHHLQLGVVALALSDGSSQAMVDLNRKVAVLRDEVPAIRRVLIERRVINPHAAGSDRQSLTLDDAAAGHWISTLRPRPIDELVARDLTDAYRPAVVVKLPLRSAMQDAGARGRAFARLKLDRSQERVVTSAADGITIVTGPPGSGKTLVLAARAKTLALAHPDWEIQVLCFNNMLVGYLRSLVGPFPNIGVTTFGKFAARLGHRIPLTGDAAIDRAVSKALPALRSNPRVDALLIDEAQDFYAGWVEFAAAAVRPGRGGAVLAGDPKQALYGQASVLTRQTRALASAQRVELQRPYRSTHQILTVTSALGPGSSVSSAELGFDGEPVDMVWCDSVKEQAAAVARDISDLVRTGERAPQDIGVLLTRKWNIGKITAALEAAKVPVRRLYAQEHEDLDLSEPTVKVMTVHSAKGLDFDVVFLVGLEDLPDDASDESQVQGRVGYVGTTRAKDQLVITYSKDNAYLERVRSLPQDMLRRWVWPDDFPEV